MDNAETVGIRSWDLSLEDKGMRFQFDRGKKLGVITRMDKADEEEGKCEEAVSRKRNDEWPR